MSDEKQKAGTPKPVEGQPDAGLAADTRPVPSQAEGDSKTIEEDLNEKEKSS